ncbi:MAG TPA: orotate phosphoribosyltransferase [Bacteroidales bacterium]|nr:orotate phosphoribosyltransferase [Bacteroidales bacterium]
MIYSKETARETANNLLQIKAIKLSYSTPFQWASGWKAPIYCDNRKTLSFPEVRNNLRDRMSEIIRQEYAAADVIAGVATGGIALGVLVAQQLNLPFVYVRSSQKGHGLQNRVEGVLQPNQKAVVIEDLVSTGKSSLNAVDALRNSEVTVLGMISIFDYGFDVARQNFDDKSCSLYSLSDYEALLEVALQENYIQKDESESLTSWRKNPENWGRNQ